jgi:uncharacterized protein
VRRSRGTDDLSPSGAAPGIGTPAILEFFGVLAEKVEFHRFEPREFIAQGDTVVVLIESEGTTRRSGRRVANHLAHVGTLREGKATRMRIFEDTRAVAVAYRGT